MISSIRGIVLEAGPLSAVIEAGGLGYLVHIPVTTAEHLPGLGSEACLHTLAIYREDSATLYGFHSRSDRDFFQLLVEKVSGVGPKIALSMMSRLSANMLQNAIAAGDVALLAKCPGIGRKTAERLVIELKDKVGLPAATAGSSLTGGPDFSAVGANAVTSLSQDAINALMTLGYKPAEADKAVRRALEKLGEDATLESVIKSALR